MSNSEQPYPWKRSVPWQWHYTMIWTWFLTFSLACSPPLLLLHFIGSSPKWSKLFRTCIISCSVGHSRLLRFWMSLAVSIILKLGCDTAKPWLLDHMLSLQKIMKQSKYIMGNISTFPHHLISLQNATFPHAPSTLTMSIIALGSFFIFIPYILAWPSKFLGFAAFTSSILVIQHKSDMFSFPTDGFLCSYSHILSYSGTQGQLM